MSALAAVRYVLPAALAVAGVVLWAAADGAPAAFGQALVVVAVLVVLANAYVRVGIASQRDRDREAQARRTFTRTGRWPTR